jgi:hypothetical protein
VFVDLKKENMHLTDSPLAKARLILELSAKSLGLRAKHHYPRSAKGEPINVELRKPG